MHSEQLKYIKLVKNITSLMIKTQLFLFIGAYTYSYSLPMWVMFFFKIHWLFWRTIEVLILVVLNFPNFR